MKELMNDHVIAHLFRSVNATFKPRFYEKAGEVTLLIAKQTMYFLQRYLELQNDNKNFQSFTKRKSDLLPNFVSKTRQFKGAEDGSLFIAKQTIIF